MIKINIAKCSRNIYPGISRTQWKLLARSNPDLFVAMAPQVLLTKRDGREGVYNTTVSNYKLFSRHPQMLLNVLSTHITTSENTFLKSVRAYGFACQVIRSDPVVYETYLTKMWTCGEKLRRSGVEYFPDTMETNKEEFAEHFNSRRKFCAKYCLKCAECFSFCCID